MMKNLKVEYVVEGVSNATYANPTNAQPSPDRQQPSPVRQQPVRQVQLEDDDDDVESWGSDFSDDDQEALLQPQEQQDSSRKKNRSVKDDEAPLFDKLGYNKTWINYKIEEAKRWLKIMSGFVVFWTAFLITLAALYQPYVKECDPDNTLSEFSLVILSYIILQRILDIVLASVSLIALKKVISKDTIDRIVLTKNLQPTESQEKKISGKASYDDTDPISLKRTAVLGMKAGEFNKVGEAVVQFSNTTAGAASAPGQISKDSARRAFLNLKHAATRVFSKRLMGFNVSHLPKPSSRVTTEYIQPHVQLERSSVGFGGKFLLSLNIIPLFSIMFFVVVGVDTISDLQKHQMALHELDYRPDLHSLPALCKANYALNWVVIGLVFVQAVFRFVPVFYRVIAAAYNPETYQRHHEHI